jgi:hypothetical protein
MGRATGGEAQSAALLIVLEGSAGLKPPDRTIKVNYVAAFDLCDRTP